MTTPYCDSEHLQQQSPCLCLLLQFPADFFANFNAQFANLTPGSGTQVASSSGSGSQNAFASGTNAFASAVSGTGMPAQAAHDMKADI